MMTKDELLKAIHNPEWTDIEFKQSSKGVSEEAYKTVSAFANTCGGYLIFGVKESANKTERNIAGVEDVDKVQNDFLSCLRNRGKLSRVINSVAELHEIEGKHVLVFYIPEADRKDKPIYLGKRIDQAYIRRGGCDELCTESELRAFIRDASDTPFDRSIEQGIDPNRFVDPNTLKWYRTLLGNRLAGKYAHQNDQDFLLEMGLLLEENGKVFPTKAAILLFGKERYVRQILPKPIVDYQRIDTYEENWDPDKRWHDRLVIESNLFEAWRVLFDKYSLIADVPFSLDETTLLRKDDSLEYRSFREAAVNLLIHQDYGDAARKAEIKIFRDKTVFWNPGSAYSSVEDLLESRHHPIRNPLIVRIFRQIGLCEEAGTGIRTIMEDCRKLGLFPAQIINDKSDFSFSLTILKQQIISEPFKELIARLDLKPDVEEAAILSYLVTYKNLSLPIAKAITGKSSDRTLATMTKLEAAGLTKSNDNKQAWSLSEHTEQQIIKPATDQATDQSTGQAKGQVKGQAKGQATGQAKGQATGQAKGQVKGQVKGQATGQAKGQAKGQVKGQAADANNENTMSAKSVVDSLSKKQVAVILLCYNPLSITELLHMLKLSGRASFRTNHLIPLLKKGVLLMSFPDSPQHPKQKYYLSDYGKTIYQALKGES